MTSRSHQTRGAGGRYAKKPVASTSTNIPGQFPDARAASFIEDPDNEAHKVQSLLAGTGPHDISFLHDSPVREEDLHDLGPPMSLGLEFNEAPQEHQTPPHLNFHSHSTPVAQPTPTVQPAAQPPSTLLPSHPSRPSRSLTPNRPLPLPPMRYAPPPGPPPPSAFLQPAQAPVFTPAPTGLDPVLWANNQALVLSLLPALHAIQQAPATHYAPPYAPQPKEGDAKAPTAFSGEDHTKLHDFVFECSLIFNVKPCTYASDQSRVIYAIQHLDGMAKQHFRRYIEQGGTDPKVNNWAAFTQELMEVFGDPDLRGRASSKLLGLKMKHTGRAHRYTILFKEAADDLGWPDYVLHQLYYNGLPDRIKDMWAQEDPPANFDKLVRDTQRGDNRFWKCEDEKKKAEATSTRTSSQPKASSSTPRSSTSKSTSSSQSTSSSSCSSASRSSTSNSSLSRSNTTPVSNTKDLSKILGPDGKLLLEERARREKLGLCTYCGENHGTDKCPTKPAGSTSKESSSSKSTTSSKSTSNSSNGSKPKGRVVQVVDPAASDSDSGDAAGSDF